MSFQTCKTFMATGKGAEGAAAPLAAGTGLRFSLCPSIILTIAYLIFVINYILNWPEICSCIFLACRNISPLIEFHVKNSSNLILDSFFFLEHSKKSSSYAIISEAVCSVWWINPLFYCICTLLFLNSGISMMLIFSKFPLNNRNIKEIIK